MIKKINFINRRKTIVVTFFLAILLVSFVSAFGVVSPYWEGRPLNIAPGETKIVNLGLQNMVGDNDVIVRVSLKQGSEIASVVEREYVVGAKTVDTEVLVTVSIPLNDSLAGKKYVVKVSFATVSSAGGSGVTLGTAIDTTFDVLVTGVLKEEPEVKNLVLIAISLLLIIAIIILIYIFRKKIFNKK